MLYNRLYVNGKWINPRNAKFLDVENPRTLKKIDKVIISRAFEIERAVEASKKAFSSWSNTFIEYRIGKMEDLVLELRKNEKILTKVISEELGVNEEYAYDTHVDFSINEIDKMIKIAKKYKFEKKTKDAIIVKEPYGVVACLCPWNYPLLQIVRKVVPALLAGNTVVLKPSKHTPLTAFHFTRCISSIGLDKGVFNLIIGEGARVGGKLAKDKDVDVISFTGSLEVGKKMYSYASENIKKLILELGGKSANIVLEGADEVKAVKASLASISYNSGQTCSALTRLIVREDRLKDIENIIKNEIKKYYENPFNKNRIVGPLISKERFIKVKEYAQLGIKEGANILIGKIPKDYKKGYYIDPIVFTNVKNNMKIAQEEIFGPVLCVITYKDEDEALEIANDSIYGLSGSVFAEEEKAIKFARKIRTGNVKINSSYHIGYPFGGYKSSGIGRENGVEGFEEYLQTKVIFL